MLLVDDSGEEGEAEGEDREIYRGVFCISGVCVCVCVLSLCICAPTYELHPSPFPLSLSILVQNGYRP